MTTSTTRSTIRLTLMVLALSVAGLAQAGTSSTSMRVGLTLVAPGQASSAPRAHGVVNADGAMAVQGADMIAVRAAIDLAPRVERMLEDAQADGARVLAVQF